MNSQSEPPNVSEVPENILTLPDFSSKSSKPLQAQPFPQENLMKSGIHRFKKSLDLKKIILKISDLKTKLKIHPLVIFSLFSFTSALIRQTIKEISMGKKYHSLASKSLNYFIFILKASFSTKVVIQLQNTIKIITFPDPDF
jgi:hypothetical protein